MENQSSFGLLDPRLARHPCGPISRRVGLPPVYVLVIPIAPHNADRCPGE